ncbi:MULTISPECIES: phage tail tape measure protein [Klebsiella]|uniref:phage tail tape measure protein n=1 Tax=Klebsiella TaxID=570 RepID=UPI001914777A|nr:phage tail tape measure protein [Klebsiella michiganensis]HCT9656992.1 phage tail tape measure protein [Klebsiella pneumoniae]
MKELTFALNLKNNLSSPLGKAQASIESFSTGAGAAIKRLAGGAAGIWATTKSLTGLLRPASDVQSALDELSTRNVSEDALKKISLQAAQFSSDYGVAATDFIGSVTTIRSALAGLTDDELPRTALAVNTLAVASKSSGEAAAQYISSLASHFAGEASRIGNVAFAENLASKTAWLVQNTGQDMAQIQQLLQGAKGTGTGYGVGMDEQLAVLGNLGNAVGSSAGSVYEAFLKNARSGAQALGVSFTDAQGRLLAFPDILDRLQAKYGDSVAGNIQLQEKLNKAFGKGALALVKTWGSADKLRKQIQALQGTQGLAGATSMADKMADIWARLSETGKRIKTAFGSALLPVFEPLINKVIALQAQFARWLEMFPNITRWLGYVVIGLSAMTAIASLLALWSGVKLLGGLLGLKTALGLLNVTLWPTRIGLLALAIQAKALAVWAGVSKVAIVAWNIVLGAGAIAMKAYAVATGAAGAAMAFLTSPITLIIGALALVAAGVWYVIRNWDTLSAAVMNTEAFQALVTVFEWVGGVIGAVWDGIRAGWDAVVDYFSVRSPVEVFRDFAGVIRGVFSSLWDYLKSSFGGVYNWIAEKLNKIPGVNIDLKGGGETPGPAAPAGMTPPAAIGAGGVGRAVAAAGKVDNSRHVGTVNVYPQNQETFDSLLESRELAAG